MIHLDLIWVQFAGQVTDRSSRSQEENVVKVVGATPSEGCF